MNENKQQDYATLVAKKSERLVTAMYLVTDLMSENEPIKHGLRKNSVSLLSSMNSLSQSDVKDRVAEFKRSLRSVTEIISLLHVASTTGIVSEMNGHILMDGFRTLQIVLEKKQPILTKEMLLVENEENLSTGSDFSSAISSSSYDVLTPLAMARNQGIRDEDRRTQEAFRKSKLSNRLLSDKGHYYIKDNLVKQHNSSNASVRDNLIQHAGVSQGATSFQVKKSSRRDEILALLIKGVDVSIKDISARIRGCSEKTIQRELNNLLRDGLVERIGEKRWSRYVLKK